MKHSNALRHIASEHAAAVLHDSVTHLASRTALSSMLPAQSPAPYLDDRRRAHEMTQIVILRSATRTLTDRMSLPRIPEAVVFDMDGLLFDTEVIYRDAMIATASRLGFEMSDQVFLPMIGLPAEASRAHLLGHYGNDFDVDAFWVESANDFHRLITGRQFLKAGVVELLSHLDRCGLRCAIATSSRHQDVQRNLSVHDLNARFHAVVAHGDYILGKPNPDPFLRAAERLGKPPEACLALEDSFNGVRSASAAGMMTVMVPDLIVPTDEIRRLCLRIARDLHEVRELLQAIDQPAAG